MENTINKLRKVVYVSINFVTVLSDLEVAVRKPNGDLLDPAPVVTEQSLGVYGFEYTPDVLGVWQERISSVTNGDIAIRSVNVVSADNSDIKAQTASIEDKVDAEKIVVDDTKVVVDATKVVVDATKVVVDSTGDNVTIIKSKTDNLPTDTASVLSDITSKVNDIDTKVSRGGMFV